MIRFIFISSIFFSSLFSLDLTKFDDRQTAISKVQEIIIKEEDMAKAYEAYILENYKLPSDSNSLITTVADTLFNKIEFDSKLLSTLTYALKTDLQEDNYIKSLYESNTFRKRTFVVDSKVRFIIKDDFAKQLLYLIKNQTLLIDGIPNCILGVVKYCKDGNHIKVRNSSGVELMTYHKDRFKTGPMIITSDVALHSNIEFSFIPKGAILYDEEGTKYVKTINSIEQLR